MSINDTYEKDARTVTGERGPTQYPKGDGLKPGAYARYARALWDEQDDELRALHTIWQQNLLFLAGHQWAEPNAKGVFRLPPAPSWRERPVTNLCLPFYKTFLAKATKNRPTWFVIPASGDAKDMQGAQLGDEVLQAKWTELRAAKLYREACGWTIATGNCWLLPYWNTRTGKLRKLEVEVECPVYDERGEAVVRWNGETGEPEPVVEVLMVPCDENGEPQLEENGWPKRGAKPHHVDQGEVGFRVLSPFRVRMDPDATRDEDAAWFVVGEPMSLRKIERLWPEKSGLVKAEGVEEAEFGENVFGWAETAGIHDSMPHPRDTRSRDLPKALVLYYYERPCEDYPEGRYWVSANGVTLEGPGPLPDEIFPLIHMVDVQVPGQLYGMATMTATVELNRAFNEKTAKIQEHENLFLNPKLLIPSESGIHKGQFTTQPGEAIKFRWPYEPKYMRLEALPRQVYAERDRIEADFEKVSGIRRISQGGVPAGVSAGIAIAQLQEADDTDLGPFLAMGEETIAELAGYLLQLIKKNYTDERIYYAAGPGRRYMVKSFRGSDLEGAVDVIPQTGSSLVLTQAARQQLLLDVVKTIPDMFRDPETGQIDSAAIARLLPFGGIESLHENEDVDLQEALREEEAFSLMGEDTDDMELPRPMPWQNARVHLRQHRRTLVTGEWKDWPDAAQQAFLQHYAETVAADAAGKMQQQTGLPMDPAAGVMPGEPMPPEEGFGLEDAGVEMEPEMAYP